MSGEKLMEEHVEQRANQYAIQGEQGAISMEATRVAGDNMSFNVECHSFSPPRVQLDETGVQSPMTEYSPPSGDVAGTYIDAVTFTSKGGHAITCFNGTTRVRQRVFAGDYPAWNAQKVADNRLGPVEDAAAIAATTSKLG